MNKIYRIILFLLFFILTIVSLHSIINLNKDIAIAENTINNTSSIIIIPEEENQIAEDPFENKNQRIRKNFASDLNTGEDYYAGLDENIDFNVEIKENKTLNTKKSLNYYMYQDLKPFIEQNTDTVAYLKVNGTNIEYPVVQTTDNSYYLSHSFDKSESMVGWVFADYRSDLKDMSKHLVIYAHNIKNKTMFGSLSSLYDDKNWFNEDINKEIYLINNNKSYVYEIFSVYITPPTFSYNKMNFENNYKWHSFIKTIANKNTIKKFNYNDEQFASMLTLSTCYKNSARRLVVHAKLIRSIDLNQLQQ